MSVNVLSLFNGMPCGMLALERSGFNVLMYYSAEIDKYANQVTADNYRGIVQLGDVTKWREWDIEWDSIDIILGGFPCQAWSMAGKQLGDKDERGMLFWTMLDIMKHVRSLNPDADFLIENVKMKKEFEEYITYHMENAVGDVYKIMIDSALVSAHSRKRYYWTSFECEQPVDRGVALMDIVESNPDEKFNLSNKLINGFYNKKGGFNGRFNPMNPDLKEKSYCLTARYFKCGATDPYIITGTTDDNLYGISARKLTPIECERLQTVPDNFTASVSNTRRYKMLGNGWTVDVISHILSHIRGKYE